MSLRQFRFTIRFALSAALHFILKRTKRYRDRRPLDDDLCGPILWRRLDARFNLASDSQRDDQ